MLSSDSIIKLRNISSLAHLKKKKKTNFDLKVQDYENYLKTFK